MTVDADLMLASLPGLYRDQDVTGELRSFLGILAGPLAELHASIAQLLDDEAVATCRPPFIPLIGALVGVEVDTTLPERAQREQVLDAISGYRTKGTSDLIVSAAESLTGWRVQLVDFSARVAQIVLVETVVPGRFTALTAPVADAAALARLGRADDDVPAVLDLRAPRTVTDAAGREHFDNLGLFVTPAQVMADRRPNALPPGDGTRLTFDDRPLAAGDTAGVRLQLLDGID
jgi:phage tail-like protein